MSNEQPNQHNENNLLEESEKNTRKMVGWAIAAMGFFLIVGIIFWGLHSLKSSKDEESEKESNVNLTDSVKNDKDWEAIGNQQSLLDLAEQTPLSQQNQITQSIPETKTGFVQPRIIKGMGVAVVNQNKDGSANNANSSQQDLTLYEKPETVFEFGQNGALNLNPNANQQGGESGNGNSSMMGEVFSPSAANFSKFNPSLLLSKGTYIGCALKTKLVSEVKGGIACIVSNDVYSSNGHTLLIEKGSTITGTYSSEGLNDGSTRLFVIWQEIRTPNNIVIPVYSNATDPLGASGMEGYIDNHYMKRFGAAILLSVIDDVLGVIANRMSKNSVNNYYDYSENTRDNASEMANTVLEKMIDIKPTLYKNQGDLVGVYVNKDIDFSKVYQLRSRKSNE